MIITKMINKYQKMSLPVKAAFWYAFCNFLNKGIALLSTPIFTRILTEEQYGTFTIFQSWFNILIIFTSLNIFLGGFAKGLLLYKDDADGFASSQLSLTSIITMLFILIYCLNIDFWTKIFSLSPTLMIMMGLELLFMPAFEFWFSKEKFDYKYKKIVIVSILMNLLSIAVSIIWIKNTNIKLEARVFSDIGVKLLFTVPLFAMIIIKGKKIFNWKYWKYALSFNLPLIPHYLSNYVLNQSDRIMIGKMVGNIQAGYYSIAYSISTVLLLLTTAINNSLVPYIYKSIESKNVNKIKSIANLLIILIGIFSVIIMVMAPDIIYIFAGKSYMDAIYVMPPIIASVYFIFSYNLFSHIEYYYQKTGFIAIATTIAATLNILLNYIGIKHYGYYAAGYTTLICYILLALCHYIFYKKILKEKMPNVKIYDDKNIWIIGLIIIIISITMAFIYKYTIIRYIIFILFIIELFAQKNKIIKIIKNLK